LFDIGFQELILIFIVALIVVGPKRLPELGKTLGKRIGELKKALDSVKAQMNAEIRELEKETSDNDSVSQPISDINPLQNISVETEVPAGSERS
jgi:Tat protein translocase TatB subunit